MKARVSIALFATLAIAVALGCGKSEEVADQASDMASQAAEKAADMANQAADKASDLASQAADKASDAASAAGEAAADARADVAAAAEGVSASATDQCLALAEDKNWADALTPCTKAATEKPGDLAIRHALQQAQAAATEGS